MPARLRRALIVAALLLLPLTLFHRALFGGEAFVPADLLGYLAPWSQNQPTPPAAWNVLRFDGAAEFYPWRWEAARQLRGGQIPLWNEFAFAARGGTPLLADSQSAPLYPPNLLFALVPPSRFWYAFGLSAALHLLVAATGMYRLLRAENLRRLAALLGAAVFVFSGPIVCWLSLPTFLAVACWLPWLLLLIRCATDGAGTRAGRLAGVGAGAVAGTMLLAGHLQVAFYGLLAAVLHTLWRGASKRQNFRSVNGLASIAGAGLLAVLLALPQLLPSIALSRVSHRAGGAATMEGYQAFIASALPLRNMVTLLVPNFFGHPNPTDAPYWNTNNYGEWAAYVGIAPLLLAVYALALPWRSSPTRGLRGFWALLLVVAFLLAMGTPLNLPLFFLVPGYRQTGNPARCLYLAAFALAALAAHGLHALLSEEFPKAARQRAALIALAGPVLVAAIGAGQAASFAVQSFPQVPFGQLLNAALPGVRVALVLLGLSAALLFSVPPLPARYRPKAGALLLLLSVGDLYVRGAGYNPTVPAAQVFPVTPGIAYLQENGRDALIAPLNRGWSLGLLDKRPPQNAVFPPNTLTAYGLHDIGGYDSLFPAAAKEQVRQAGNGEDPSPPENGNMVFIKQMETAVALGGRYLVFAPATAPLTPPSGLREAYRGDDLVIWENPTGKTIDHAPGHAYAPESFRVGLFGGLTAVGVLAAVLTATGTSGRSDRTKRSVPGDLHPSPPSAPPQPSA